MGEIDVCQCNKTSWQPIVLCILIHREREVCSSAIKPCWSCADGRQSYVLWPLSFCCCKGDIVFGLSFGGYCHHVVFGDIIFVLSLVYASSVRWDIIMLVFLKLERTIIKIPKREKECAGKYLVPSYFL